MHDAPPSTLNYTCTLPLKAPSTTHARCPGRRTQLRMHAAPESALNYACTMPLRAPSITHACCPCIHVCTWTLDPKPWTPDPARQTLDPKSWTQTLGPKLDNTCTHLHVHTPTRACSRCTPGRCGGAGAAATAARAGVCRVWPGASARRRACQPGHASRRGTAHLLVYLLCRRGSAAPQIGVRLNVSPRQRRASNWGAF
eukprot:349627-Chlamydomonas_euryale.AAC.6